MNISTFFLRIISVAPLFSFIIASIYYLVFKEQFLHNNHWLIVGVVALQLAIHDVTKLYSKPVVLFVSAIIFNIAVLLAPLFSIAVPKAVLIGAVCFIALGFIVFIANILLDKYRAKSESRGG
ncbi:hypothetical protein [Thalassotalea marina]|uniref:Uncharacterized protein n=1 Tax=Thalassotalea marina TaxID=1673741 RepID=A0A919EM04_9GAMM|nr:hypothetical protein [Thalassotalea marina]GHF93573.1 hypothetical protein GCM10017161_22520 [Thalassotalea marina]